MERGALQMKHRGPEWNGLEQRAELYTSQSIPFD